MSKFREFGLALFLCLPSGMTAQAEKSLSSAYVACVRNERGVDVASRKIQTPVFTSKKGARAFGVAAAELSAGSCRNRTILYVAEPHGSYRAVYRQEAEPDGAGSTYDGNGIKTIRWSPSGKRLLVEISQWTWGSDFGENTKYVVFTSHDHWARRISPIAAMWKSFKQPCTASIESLGWIDDEQIEVEANPFVDTGEDGSSGSTPSCVGRSARFSFDVGTGGLFARNR